MGKYKFSCLVPYRGCPLLGLTYSIPFLEGPLVVFRLYTFSLFIDLLIVNQLIIYILSLFLIATHVQSIAQNSNHKDCDLPTTLAANSWPTTHDPIPRANSLANNQGLTSSIICNNTIQIKDANIKQTMLIYSAKVSPCKNTENPCMNTLLSQYAFLRILLHIRFYTRLREA